MSIFPTIHRIDSSRFYYPRVVGLRASKPLYLVGRERKSIIRNLKMRKFLLEKLVFVFFF